MHPKDWEGGVRAGTEAYLASPPRGEVGLLAQRARRVGSYSQAKDSEEGSGDGSGGRVGLLCGAENFGRINS